MPAVEQDEVESSDDEIDPSMWLTICLNRLRRSESSECCILYLEMSTKHEINPTSSRNVHEQCETRIATLEKQKFDLFAENARF